MMPIQESQIIHMLEECTSVDEPSYEKKLPQQICTHCFWQLKNAYEFKQQCLLSLEILFEVVVSYENNTNIENENKNIPIDIKNQTECTEKINDHLETDQNDITQNLYLEEFDDNNSILQDDMEIHEEENSSRDENKMENIIENGQKSLADILRKKYNIYDLTCNICNKELSTRATLLRHMDIHDTNRSLNYQCKICNKRFYAQENLRKHENRHMGKTKYQCDRCPKKFYVLSALGVHTKTRHKANPIKCSQCTAKFYHQLQLEQHQRNTHTEKKEYVCDVCGKEFTLKYYLREHQITHSNVRHHTCEYCKKGFKHKGTLRAHIKLVHIEPERREMCNVCGKLILPSTLRSHLESHDKETVYKCPDCGKIYNNKYVLRGHINEKHNAESGTVNTAIVCKICNKNLTSKRTLKTHMIVMHSEMKKRECHICGKAYKLQCNVNAHIQSAHMDVRPHICSTCNKAFHTKTLLRNHMRTHTGERPFSCSICGKSFGFKGVLSTHMKVHTNIDFDMSPSININDFHKICRICLITKEKMVPINTPEVIFMLEDCSSVQESYEQKMPQQLCENCFWQLKNAYDFRQQCVVSMEILCEILRQDENSDEKNSIYLEDKSVVDVKCVTTTNNSEDSVEVKSELGYDEVFSQVETLLDDDGKQNDEKYSKRCMNAKVEKVENSEEDENDETSSCSSDEYQEDRDHDDDLGSDNEATEGNEQKQRSLADILIKKYKIYDLTCNICKKEISTRSTLLRHMETHDTNRPLKYHCSICKKGFYTSENLKKHVNRHMGKTKFSCDKCPKRFYVLSALGVHYKSSHKAEPIQCSQCPSQFYHPLQLEQHEQNHGEKKYVCDVCGKVFPKKNRLTKHKKYHSEERPFTCNICERGFKTKADLTSHVKLRHVESDRREVCYICGKLIPVGTLTIHLDTHKDRSVKCSECDKIFASKIILDRHINHIHRNGGISQKYYCDICNKALGSKGSLKTHMITTHSDDKKNECHICGKTYKLLSHVRAHIQSAHMDVRPHICSICSKAFHTKLLLKNHMRTHTGERPFPCSICGKAFGFKNVLNTHMKVHSKS
ncbi:zinc finger protein 615-like [Chrysoperla carnea]|uniref:zinc finger protein 615-like n=1 Tax=Chrysoperla carnea TaxID=189513 RepID=UPI001D066801|nr:zinc finger protein 615-like [Chrysoperla carnea]